MQFQVTLLAAFAAIANAAVPTTKCTDACNPISLPSMGQNLPVGKIFTITWKPTTTGTVSLQLLKGPPTNVVPVGPQIVSGIANTGSYDWTPAGDLVESLGGGYALQLISDIDGTFQYSVQFGISIPSAIPASSAASTKLAASTDSAAPSNETIDHSPIAASKYQAPSTGYPMGNSSADNSTSLLSKPSGNATQLAVSTGAASQLGMSFGGAVVALAGAIFVL